MRKFIKFSVATVIFWLVTVALSFGIYQSADGAPKTEVDCVKKISDCTAESPCCLGNVKVYVQGNSSYGELERDDAIEFGLDKIDTTINYLFIAAAGVFALLGKIVIEPLVNGQSIKYLSGWVTWLIINSALLSAFSVISGFVARLTFTSIGSVEGFSIYGDLGVGILNQFFLVTAAFILLVITIFRVIAIKRREGK